MFKKNNLLFLLLLTTVACSVVPFSNRKRINIVPDDMMLNMSFSNYNEFLTQNPPMPVSNANTKMVKEVGNKLATAVSNYMNAKGMGSEIKDFKWEFNLVTKNEVNAWCMPGGKVVVYTGLLPISIDAEGLAVVMGHEIAHAVAKHGSERMSQQLIFELGGMTLAAALEKKPEATKSIFMTAFGVGSTLGTLAYSREHEYEADKLGLFFMAMAGYNPNKAIAFWERMSLNGSSSPFELLSTHPSDANRIAEMKKNLVEAMQYLKK
ncbi:MAG: M48 family metallopeptidase [Bacteroidales bacterium]